MVNRIQMEIQVNNKNANCLPLSNLLLIVTVPVTIWC